MTGDEELARIIAAVGDRLAAGESVDADAVLAAHPEHAERLRELLPALNLTEEAARAAPADAPPPPGRFGDYEIEAEIGRGGVGVVYRARQVSLDRTVALKVLLSGPHAGPSEVARFLGEARAAARLDHDHIVPVHEVGEVGGRHFFTMRLVEGTTLAKRLAAGPLPPREAAEILLPVARAVAAAHAAGLLHRDLKPSNVLIDEAGRPLDADFGLARPIAGGEGITRSGAVLGTPGYMAPEQASGSRGCLTPATDVYGLGAILYHALTGRAPFVGPTPVETLYSVLEQDPIPPRLLAPRVDPDLELVALKCLQKPPELRYASADDLADDLAAWLEGRTVAARSGSFRQVLSLLTRETHHAGVLRNWGVLWMLHAVMLLLLCVATNAVALAGTTTLWPFVAIWAVGLGAWASLFWALRRRAGPVTFVERQIAHVWAGAVISSVLLFFVERALGFAPLTLAPVLALISGSVFLVKAAVLSGSFYLWAGALYASAFPMAAFPRYAITIFGLVSFASFFVPGWRIRRDRLRDAR